MATCQEAQLDLPGISRLPGPNDSESFRGLRRAPLQTYQKASIKNVKSGFIPGYCSVAIWRDRILHFSAHGFRDVERRLPMTPDTIVRLYCMGKSIVATGLMVLVEKGLCSLEDDVAKFIPSFRKVQVIATPTNAAPSSEDTSPASTITLRRLLTHTSGLGYGKEFNYEPESPSERSYARLVRDVEKGRVKSLAAFCDQIAKLPLRFDPGTKFEYSYGLDVIGRVIEVASKMTLDKFLDENMFKPLGMFDTGFCVPTAKLSRLAALYGGFDTATRLDEPPEERPDVEWRLCRIDGQTPEDSAWAEGSHCPVLSGGGIMGNNRGGLVSTLIDQARFFLALARGGELYPGGPRILREETVKLMVGEDWLRMPESIGTPQTNTGLGGVTASGEFGWNAVGEIGMVSDPSNPDAFEPGEYGYAGIAETFWSINPKRELIILWFSQQVDNRSWTTPAANLWTAARLAVDKVPVEARRTPFSSSPSRASNSAARDGVARSRSRKPRRRLSGKQAVAQVM